MPTVYEQPGPQPSPAPVQQQQPVQSPVQSPPAAPSATPSATPRRRSPAAEKKPRRSASWRPDPRWRHPVEFALWVYVLGYVPLLFGLPAAAVVAVGICAGLVGMIRARAAFPRVDYGDALPRQLTVLSVVGGGAASAWLWHAAGIGSLAAFGWLVVLAVPLGLIYAVLRSTAPKWQAKVTEAEQARAVEHARDLWDQILTEEKIALRVEEVRDTRAGQAVAVTPSSTATVTFDTLRGKLPEITARASRLLAREGVTIGKGDIAVEETAASHIFVIHVRTKHVLTQTIPFEPLGHPATGNDPIDPALYEDGRDVEVALVGPGGGIHGMIVGASGSGKSTTAQAHIASYAETVDVIQGVVATDKLPPLVWPFLRPYIDGRADAPGIDFVAGQDPDRVLAVLAGLYLLTRDRNTRLPDSGLFEISPSEPGIILWVEETADAINRCGRIEVRGQNMTFSMLVDGITRAGRSAQIAVVQLNQFALVDKYGERGSEIFRNSTYRVCHRTMSSYDGPAVLPGLVGLGTDTTKLRHHSMLVQPSITEARVMPAKSYSFDDGEIDALVISVAGHRPTLGEREARVLGEAWSRRWDADRLPELVAKAAAEGLTWPHQSGAADPALTEEDRVGGEKDDIDREWERLSALGAPDSGEPAGGGGELPPPDSAVADIADIAARAGRVTLPEPLESVMRMLEDAPAGTVGEFVSTRQLAVWLERVPVDVSDEDLDAAASELGRQLSEVDVALRTVQRRVEGGRARGYDVATLRKIAARIARESGR